MDILKFEKNVMSYPISLPSPADKIIDEFVKKITTIEPGFIEGVYLTGSLALNDFHSGKSDIDFLVLCKMQPDRNIISQLKHIHRAIQKHYAWPNLSGSYITTDSIQSDNPGDLKVLTWHEGSLHIGAFEMAPISLYELKYKAITIQGKKAESLVVNITREDVNKFLYSNINAYWVKWLYRHSSYFRRKVLLLFFPRLTEWSILGVCRQLCTLQTGKIVSKTEAGLHCLLQLPEQYHLVIKEAIEIRKDNRTYPFVKSYAVRPSFRRCRQTIDCLGYLIQLINTSQGEFVFSNRR